MVLERSYICRCKTRSLMEQEKSVWRWWSQRKTMRELSECLEEMTTQMCPVEAALHQTEEQQAASASRTEA